MGQTKSAGGGLGGGLGGADRSTSGGQASATLDPRSCWRAQLMGRVQRTNRPSATTDNGASRVVVLTPTNCETHEQHIRIRSFRRYHLKRYTTSSTANVPWGIHVASPATATLPIRRLTWNRVRCSGIRQASPMPPLCKLVTLQRCNRATLWSIPVRQ